MFTRRQHDHGFGLGHDRQLPACYARTSRHGHAADKSVTIGIDLSLTGADAETAVRIRDGFMLAIDEANAKGGAAGYHLNVLLLDDGTATAGQYDPAQGATNARKMVADPICRRGARDR